jgi:hypothetical protein
MPKIHCSVTAYHTSKAGKLNVPAVAVENGIYSNVILFPSPPIPEAIFQAMIASYVSTYGIYKDGGSAQKGPYEIATDKLSQAMDQLALFVDDIANGDANIITIAGYVPTKGTTSSAPKPTILTTIIVSRGNTGQLLAECEKQLFVDTYVCILTPNAPPPANVKITDGGQLVLAGEKSDGSSPIPMPPMPLVVADTFAIFDFNKSRKKKFTGLNPGTMYYFTFFGINAQGVGDFSVPVGMMCW